MYSRPALGDAYTPGLTVTRAATVRKTRRLPLPGTVLVKVGDVVKAGDVVARTELPGRVHLLNLANALGALADEIEPKLEVPVGGAIREGAPIARSTSLFGLPKNVVASPIPGTLESVSAITGMAILREPPVPVEVTAYVDGTVVEIIPDEGVVIEAKAALVQGIFGLAGEKHATIAVACTERDMLLTAECIGPEHKGLILIGGARVTLDGYRAAIAHGVAAIVTGGISYQDVKELLGYDVGVAVTGNEALGTTLVVTEGFGDIAMARATYELLTSLQGQMASVNGATQIRAGVIRPEVIVPNPAAKDAPEASLAGLEIGVPVRGIRAPYFGRIGTIVRLPVELFTMPSETKVRVLEVDFAGDKVIVPRATVEVFER